MVLPLCKTLQKWLQNEHVEEIHSSIPIHAMYPKGLGKGAEKNGYSFRHTHNSMIHTGKQTEAIQVSMAANSINKLWYTHNGIWFGPSKSVILTMRQCGQTLWSLD